MSRKPSGPPDVKASDYAAIRDFLHDEAAILDARRYRDWISLLAEDMVYRVFLHASRNLGAPPERYAIIDEDLTLLTLRTEQLSTGQTTHAENPPSWTRHFVANLRVRHGQAMGEFEAETALLVHRGGGLSGTLLLSGRRNDLLRRGKDGFLIVRREIELDDTMIRGMSVSVLI